MRGMQPLVDLRRLGYRPSIAFVDVDAGPHPEPHWVQWQETQAAMAEIDVEASEALHRIDWRPLFGMVVHVSGTNGDRVLGAARAIQEAGAKRVIYALLEQIGDDEFIAFKQLWVFDTEGLAGPKEDANGSVAA